MRISDWSSTCALPICLHSDYALRILMALSATGRQMSVDEIAGQYGISRNHLAKVAQRLQALGYVSAQRGRGGGLTLAREPDAVLVGTVVREFEHLEGLVECMDPATPTCPVCAGRGPHGAPRRDLDRAGGRSGKRAA